MMRLARRASLLVAFYLLTSAATAYAECAWVLWTQTVILNKDLTHKAPQDEWLLQSAHPSYSACVERARALALQYPHNLAMTLAFGAQGKFVESGEQGVYKLSFFPEDRNSPGWPGGTITIQCLSDTVDPRGPKGK